MVALTDGDGTSRHDTAITTVVATLLNLEQNC